MTQLGNGLSFVRGSDQEALRIRETELATMRRLGLKESSADMLQLKSNIAGNYFAIGRHQMALDLRTEAYVGFKKMCGPSDENTLIAAKNLVLSLLTLEKFAEAKSFLREPIVDARRNCNDDHTITLGLRCFLADALTGLGDIDNLRAAVPIREDVLKRTRQVFGKLHPLTRIRQDRLERVRAVLARAEAQHPSLP